MDASVVRVPSSIPSAVVWVHIVIVRVIKSRIPGAVVPRVVESSVPTSVISTVPVVVIPRVVAVMPAVSVVVPRVVPATVAPRACVIVVVPRGIPVAGVVLVEVADGDAGADAVLSVYEQIHRRFFGLLDQIFCLLLGFCIFTAFSE